MIYKTGKQTPTPEQRRIVHKIADDTFRKALPGDFGALPCGDDYRHALEAAIAIKLKCCHPHEDDWSGDGTPPKSFAALFWHISGGDVWLQVGADLARLQPGDYVVFDDSVLHCVVADRVWRGVACQMVPIDEQWRK